MRYVTLGDVCKKASSNVAQKDILSIDGEYPIYGASGLIKTVDFYHQEQPYIAIVKDGAGVGRSMLLPEHSSVIGTMQYIIPNELVDIKYLYYAIVHMNLAKYYMGAAIPHIYFRDYQKEPLKLPLLSEQKRIAAIFEKIDSIIEFRNTQLAQLEQVVKSRFIELFGEPIANQKNLPVKTLKEISTLITNGNTPKGGSENYVENGITFLRSQNVWRNNIVLDDVAYIDEETHESMKKSSVHYKDILITKTGRINTENSSLGRAALYLGEDDSANINGHVYLVRLDDTVVPEYVVTILTGEAYRRYIRKVCVGGIDKRQINLDQVEEFPIILPPKEQQEQFADFVRQIDKSKYYSRISLVICQSMASLFEQEWMKCQTLNS